MLRVTTKGNADDFMLKLEGCLAGPWVDEVEACWYDSIGTLDGRHLWIDLGDVCSVDQRGRQLLERMYRAGVRFVTRGFVMPELVREIAESSRVAALG